MTQWLVLFRKEILEMSRNYKLIWIPLVFILLGIMQPVSSYFMPQILDSVGGLPEGAVIDIPLPTGQEVLFKVLSNYSMFGTLILVLSAMGIVAGEKQSGVAGMVMMKPVPHFHYISSKLAGLISITLVSFLLGYFASWYYTNLLIDDVPFQAVWKSAAIYCLWLVFIVTLTLFLSTVMKSNGGIAFVSLLSVAALSIVTSVAVKYMEWSPARASAHAGALLNTGETGEGFLLSVIVSVLLIAALLVFSVQVFKQKELIE